MDDKDRPRTRDWSSDESYWRETYRSRPYTDESRDFDTYRPAYKYGYDSLERVGDRPWNEAEPELRSGWDRYADRGQSKWDDVKDSVKDAWDRVTGRDR